MESARVHLLRTVHQVIHKHGLTLEEVAAAEEVCVCSFYESLPADEAVCMRLSPVPVSAQALPPAYAH